MVAMLLEFFFQDEGGIYYLWYFKRRSQMSNMKIEGMGTFLTGIKAYKLSKFWPLKLREYRAFIFVCKTSS